MAKTHCGIRQPLIGLLLLVVWMTLAFPAGLAAQDEYLRLSAKEAQKIGESMRVSGRVGGFMDTRIIGTSRSYNFKLRATWFTPEVIRATARYFQLRQGLNPGAAQKMIAEAQAVEGTVIMVEIDPREGSGVVPLEWESYLRPKDQTAVMVAGVKRQELRKVKVFGSVYQRDYSYDRFWIVFPLTTDDGEPLFPASVKECELIVRIQDKEGRVDWPVPDSMRQVAGPGVPSENESLPDESLKQ